MHVVIIAKVRRNFASRSDVYVSTREASHREKRHCLLFSVFALAYHPRQRGRAAAELTRQTTLPTSSATINAPVLSSATPTGRPRTVL
jgi:hypothetical protein